MPFEPETPLAAPIVELPVPCVSVTALPATALPAESFRITVTTEHDVVHGFCTTPVSETGVGLALTFDWPGSAAVEI